MPQQKRPEQVPQRSNEAADPDPDGEPKVSEEPKGQPPSHLNESEESGENEKKRQVVEKLRERERILSRISPPAYATAHAGGA